MPPSPVANNFFRRLPRWSIASALILDLGPGLDLIPGRNLAAAQETSIPLGIKESDQETPRDRYTALIFSTIVPGAGHFYRQQWEKGTFLIGLFLGGMALSLAGSMIDAPAWALGGTVLVVTTGVLSPLDIYFDPQTPRDQQQRQE